MVEKVKEILDTDLADIEKLVEDSKARIVKSCGYLNQQTVILTIYVHMYIFTTNQSFSSSNCQFSIFF